MESVDTGANFKGLKTRAQMAGDLQAESAALAEVLLRGGKIPVAANAGGSPDNHPLFRYRTDDRQREVYDVEIGQSNWANRPVPRATPDEIAQGGALAVLKKTADATDVMVEHLQKERDSKGSKVEISKQMIALVAAGFEDGSVTPRSPQLSAERYDEAVKALLDAAQEVEKSKAATIEAMAGFSAEVKTTASELQSLPAALGGRDKLATVAQKLDKLKLPKNAPNTNRSVEIHDISYSDNQRGTVISLFASQKTRDTERKFLKAINEWKKLLDIKQGSNTKADFQALEDKLLTTIFEDLHRGTSETRDVAINQGIQQEATLKVAEELYTTYNIKQHPNGYYGLGKNSRIKNDGAFNELLGLAEAAKNGLEYIDEKQSKLATR